MNKTALLGAVAVASLCAAAMLTLLTWPPTDPITWRPLTSPAWWQLEWIGGLGFLLSAAPSFVIYSFDSFFATNEQLRHPVAAFLISVEAFSLAYGTYKLVRLLQRPRKSG